MDSLVSMITKPLEAASAAIQTAAAGPAGAAIAVAPALQGTDCCACWRGASAPPVCFIHSECCFVAPVRLVG